MHNDIIHDTSVYLWTNMYQQQHKTVSVWKCKWLFQKFIEIIRLAIWEKEKGREREIKWKSKLDHLIYRVVLALYRHLSVMKDSLSFLIFFMSEEYSMAMEFSIVILQNLYRYQNVISLRHSECRRMVPHGVNVFLLCSHVPRNEIKINFCKNEWKLFVVVVNLHDKFWNQYFSLPAT